MEHVARTDRRAGRPGDEPSALGEPGGTTRVRPELLRIVADPVALQALTVLSRESLSACHLARSDGPGTLVADRLGDLAAAGLVETERFGGELYYRLRPGGLDPVRPLMPWIEDCPENPPHRPCC